MFSPFIRAPQRTIGFIVAFAFLVRVALSPGANEANLDPDGAHLLNVARCFAEGYGFSNPAAWPAWMNPASLPMPETFKEPAYSWLLSKLVPLTGDWFRTGQWISIVAGSLVPWATYALARRRGVEPAIGLLAALLVAVSPIAVEVSVRVMVEATFTLMMTLMFLAASAPDATTGESAERPIARDALAGVLFGLTFMLRAQAMLLVLPLLMLLFERRALRTGVTRLVVFVVAAVATTSPLWLRNLKTFGTPLYSDVTTFALWPYVDHAQFSHGLEHPPAIVPFVLAHVPQVLAHMLRSSIRFANDALPLHLLGSVLWLVPLAAGILLALRTPRPWAFALVFLGTTFVFISALHWDARYFSSGAPLWCALTATGAVWLVRAVGEAPLWRSLTAKHLFAAVLVVSLAGHLWVARRDIHSPGLADLDAARASAAYLNSKLAADESVMGLTTSYWAWFSHRPSVHLVIADDARVEAVLERLRVRYVALPTSRLAEFAKLYPAGRLPRSFVVDHVDAEHDLTMFTVRLEPAR